MKKVLLVVVVLLATVVSNAQKVTVTKTLKAFEQAYQNKDYSAVKELLAPEFSVGYGDPSSNDFYFKVIFKAFPDLDSLQEGKSVVVKGETHTAVRFFFKGKEAKDSEIVFNKDNKMLYVSFFDSLYKVDRNAEVKKVASIPFEMIGGGIALKIKLNNADKEFLMKFDTGADGMALNPDSAYKAGVVVTNKKSASVVGGSQQVEYSANNTIRIGNQTLTHQGLVIFPRSDEFDGLFGANLLRNFITEVNFDTKTINLYNFGKFVYEGKAKPLFFDYKIGLPVVKMNLTFADKKTVEGDFTFDTGAGYNLIAYGPFNHEFNLEESLKPDYTSTNFSLGHQTKIVGGTIPNIAINGNDFKNVTIALQEYQEDNQKWASADGSLGIELIKRFNFTIDLVHKTLYLEPNKNYNTAFSFFLSGLELSFDNQNNLIVKKILKANNEDLKKVTIGAKVIQIGDFEAKDLLHSENIQKLKNNKESIDVILEQNSQSLLITLKKK
ncbi:retropepsin-like aspartic protease [Flavobacterium agrisoli]|uniref:Retropepsin-like domain-containing protein n=1 Tax=Flavobacterium agrisoli TaxID=2793066 RepID=A0A934PK15_9FLAO|nr:retropepsin-like aspartic protease [Flavobacterium agrisoli]MBK0368314.1 retropepsin-like domain-containing protein [Flavobacterium agrisoli]